ncbi:MAG: hypothetical protein KJO80_14745 [Gammaproteobacteria bacterium]|nr:hypothetical protein [Gammaproteobacteria bacterium]
MKNFSLGGLAMVFGGALLVIVNAVFTPMLDTTVPFPEMMASTAYLWRLSLAALAVFALMVGSAGVHRHQASHTGLFGKLAFGLAFLGSAFLFAHEWGQVFFIHSMALAAPDALQAMEDTPGMNAFDLEAMIVLGTFTLGWILFAVSMLLAKVFARPGPVLVIAGFFAIPLLSALTSPLWGGVLGNAVLGSGFILIGRELKRN